MPIRTAGRIHATARMKTPPPTPKVYLPTHPVLDERMAAGLSRLSVARSAGIDTSTLWRVEVGEVNPQAATLAAIQRAIQALKDPQ